MTWIGLDFDVFHVQVDAVNKETLCRPEYTVVMRAYACADEKRGRVHLPPALKKDGETEKIATALYLYCYSRNM